MLRGALVIPLLNPLDVVRIRQQQEAGKNALTIFKASQKILEEEGLKGFINGTSKAVKRNAYKQPWNWPMVVIMPPLIQNHLDISAQQSQVITGISVATMDAGLLFQVDKKIYEERVAAIKQQLLPGAKPPSIMFPLAAI